MAWRQMVKRKGYTFINVCGLAIGLAACLLIGAYVQEELSYDRHHEKSEQIYRITENDLITGKQWAPIGPPVGQALKENFPQIEEVVRFIPLLDGVVLSKDKSQHREEGLLYADPSVFDVFTIPFIQGNPATALEEPNTIVLSESLAQKYFGQDNPYGETITLNNKYHLRVTGIIEDPPPTSHMNFDALLPLRLLYERYGGSEWLDQAKDYPMLYTYILLGSNNSKGEIERQIPYFVDDYFSPKSETKASAEMELALQPLTGIHLHSSLEKEIQANGNVAYVYLFVIMGLLLLAMAVINFVNLSTAQSVERGTEAAVRKTLGAFRNALIGQFMWESIIMVLVAFTMAYMITLAVLPFFRDITGQALPAHFMVDPLMIIYLLAAIVLIGLLAGSYPAYVLIKARTTDMLTGKKLSLRQGSQLRKSLIVIQFVFAILLLTGATVVYQQMDYLTSSPLGFDKEHLIEVPIGPTKEQEASRQSVAIQQELGQQPLVVSSTFVSGIPGKELPFSRFDIVNPKNQTDEEAGQEMRVVFGVDKDYTKTMGLSIIHGQDFTHVHSTDSTGEFLLNQAAVRAMNLTNEEALEKTLKWDLRNYTGPIVGVIEDFHYRSLYHEVEPLVLPLLPRATNGHLLVRIKAGNPDDALAQIESVWKRMMPDHVFNYAFMDKQMEALYRSEQRMSSVITAFTLLALFLACLGLLGLTTLMIAQRTKEISIRKVLGQSVSQVVVMLSGEFAILVGMSILLALPLAWLLTNHWLSGFAYRISLQIWYFFGAGVTAMVIAMVTVGSQATRAANKSPADGLRDE